MQKPSRNHPESSAAAEQIAIQALGFLAADPQLLPRFLALTGIQASQIRAAAREPGFLAGVIAFFLAHEPSLMQLSDAIDVDPATIRAAAKALPSGDDHYEQSM